MLLVAVLALAGLVVPVAAAPPALACSCAAAEPAEHFARAQAVFTGTVVERRQPDSGYSAAPAVYVVAVSRVYKGDVTATQEVVTAASGVSCGLELPATGPALFYASTGDTSAEGGVRPGQLGGSLCGGSRAGTDVPASFGAGRPPRAQVTANPPPPDDRAPSWLAVALAAGVLAVAAATALALRRRREG